MTDELLSASISWTAQLSGTLFGYAQVEKIKKKHCSYQFIN